MAAEVAPPKSTGGGGFVFEDKVCAWFLTLMLTDQPPLEAELGRIERMHFQTRPDGWYFDDLLLTLARGQDGHRWAISIKSNVQFSDSTAPPDFVRIAWEQFLHDGSDCFDESTDFMGLITVPLSNDLDDALTFVVKEARNSDPRLLPARYRTHGWANDNKRILFQSFSCPTGLMGRYAVGEEDIGRLLSRLRFLQFDFERLPSQSENDAIDRCRWSLVSGDLTEAIKLWDRLLEISAQRRPLGGYITRKSLVDILRSDFRLVDRPDHMSDWTHLLHLTKASIMQVPDSIAGRVRLPRDLDPLQTKVDAKRAVFLGGRSGVGKSSMAKRLAQKVLSDNGKCLWFDSHSFNRVDYAAFVADLQLTHEFAEIVRLVPDHEALLVLDGLDRIFDSRAFSIVSSLLNAIEVGQSDSPWCAVITCRTTEQPRLQRQLFRAGCVTKDWVSFECQELSIDDLKPVWLEIPAAGRLQSQRNLRSVLVNLKILDLIASSILIGVDVPTSNWVGESSVAVWFWTSLISHHPDGVLRARFAAILAERQADALKPGIPLTDFEVSELSPLHSLLEDRICRRTMDDQVLFEHDLFGDWARLWILISRQDSLAEFLKSRLDSPLWHRATRLYGIYVLEHLGDLERWRAVLFGLEERDGVGAGDLLLDSVIFAADSLPLLERVRPELMRDDGRLLKRLLVRFHAFCTLPDPNIEVLIGKGLYDDVKLAARYRSPYWYYWRPMLLFLYKYREDMLQVAPAEIGDVIDLWLTHAPTGTVLRKEAAEIGLLLGEWALAHEGSYRNNRELYFRVGLAGASELPDAVASFAIKTSKRSPDAMVRSSPSERSVFPKFIRMDPRFDPDAPLPDPWPDGPYDWVDQDFRQAVLDSAALIPLMRVRPKIAREVILATLIKPRRQFEWAEHVLPGERYEINDDQRWHPPLYVHGPFLSFLRVNFDEGLEVISRLVQFSTKQWSNQAQLEARRQADGGFKEDENNLLGRMMKEWNRPPNNVVVPLESGDTQFIGDDRVYGWPTANGNPPSAVATALMALEQYFYMELDQERPIGDKIRTVLERVRSTAFLKVLCDVGKRKPKLFEGPLRPVLVVPEIYYWDLRTSVGGRTHLMIGAPMHGEWFTKLAREFHELKHRFLDLRYVSMEMMLNKPDMGAFFEGIKRRCENRLSSEPEGPYHDIIHQLVAILDISNYRVIDDPERAKAVVNVRLVEMQTEHAEERRASEEKGLVIQMPVRCREMIDKGEGVPVDRLDGFWDDLQRLSTMTGIEWATTEGVQPTDAEGSLFVRFLRFFRGVLNHDLKKPALPLNAEAVEAQLPPLPDGCSRTDVINAVAGGIAVLIRFHKDWLGEGRQQWCLGFLQAVELNDPRAEPFDVPESLTDWTWDCFIADALPILWAEDLENVHLRYLVSMMVFAPHYKAIEILFLNCAQYRCDLGADFGRLRRLAFEYASLKEEIWLAQHAQRIRILSEKHIQEFGQMVSQWSHRRVLSFVERGLPFNWNDWGDMDPGLRCSGVEDLRERWHRKNRLDFQLIMAAHSWLPALNHAIDPNERREWLRFWASALEYVLRDAKESDVNRDSYPREEGHWVLNGVAAVLQHMDTVERPEDFWRAILDLPSEADDWVVSFFEAFYRYGLSQDQIPPNFPLSIRAMIEYALIKPRGKLRWPYYSDVWDAVIGIDHSSRRYWQDRHRDFVVTNWDLFHCWFMRFSTNGYRLAAFARWLEGDAAQQVRLDGLCLLASGMLTDNDRVYKVEYAVDAVASLLSFVWQYEEARLRQKMTAFDSFKALLRLLTEQQNAVALELIGRIGRLI